MPTYIEASIPLNISKEQYDYYIEIMDNNKTHTSWIYIADNESLGDPFNDSKYIKYKLYRTQNMDNDYLDDEPKLYITATYGPDDLDPSIITWRSWSGSLGCNFPLDSENVWMKTNHVSFLNVIN